MKPYYEEPGITIYCGDCREILPGVKVDSVDLILTDPPYGIPDGSAFRRSGLEIKNEAGEGWNVYVEGWHKIAALLLKDGGYLAEFTGGGWDLLDRTRMAHQEIGLTLWRPFLMIKKNPPPTPRATFVSGFEQCVISYKGKRKWYGGGMVPDRWIGIMPSKLPGWSGHPTEKPLAAIKTLVSSLSPEGGVVVDPFMGSGTTARACKELGRLFIGIEIEEHYCETAVKRLAQGALEFV